MLLFTVSSSKRAHFSQPAQIKIVKTTRAILNSQWRGKKRENLPTQTKGPFQKKNPGEMRIFGLRCKIMS